MVEVKWCQLELLLTSLYGFNHMPCSNLQTAKDNGGFCKLLVDFINQLESELYSRDEGSRIWPSLSEQDLHRLKQAATLLSSASNVCWYPAYGSAILAFVPTNRNAQLDPGAESLWIVGLDSWRFDIHSTSLGEIHHTARCDESQILPCGSISVGSLVHFNQELQHLLNKAEALKAKHRSAAGGKQGHQKTPAFLHALALQALGTLNSTQGGSQGERLPRGGFTDVGLHTGGTPRDTSWFLVRETLRVLLNHSFTSAKPAPGLFELTAAHLHLWLLKSQVHLLQPAQANSQMINATMKMLQTTALAAKQLAECGHDVTHIEAGCGQARCALEAVSDQRAKQLAQANTFPVMDGSVGSLSSDIKCPEGSLPAVRIPLKDEGGLAAAQLRAAENLGSLPVCDSKAGQNSFQELLNMLQTIRVQDDLSAQHALHAVERELFLRAAAGLDSASGLTEADVEALTKLWDAYRVVLKTFSGFKAFASRMQVEVHSRLVLVSWVVYCMVHAATCKHHPMLAEYGVALRLEDLRHLSVSDRAACNALLAVASYLQQYTVPGKELFSLRDGGSATFTMAERFAKGDSSMRSIRQAEARAATQRVALHWQEVQRKQQLARELRQQLARQESQKAVIRRQLSDESNSYFRHEDNLRHYRRLLNYKEDEIRETSSQLALALESPVPIIQPVPESDSQAYRWMFFLYMPSIIRQLSRASFLAQEVLLEYSLAQRGACELPKTNLTSHYNSHQKSAFTSDTGRQGREGRVLFMTNQGVPSTLEVKLTNIDRYTTSSDGIWYPDRLPQQMAWKGSGCSADILLNTCSNPFTEFPNRDMVDAFTENLIGEAKALQWALSQYGSTTLTAPERGNQGVAQQDLRPHWLSKPGFLDFCSLRADSLKQLRQLCVALKERSLPLGHTAVQTLIQQALYHCGTLTQSQPPQLVWRTDWEPGGVLSTLCHELRILAEELENAPREHQSVLLLGEVAGFLSEWHPPLREVARAFGRMAARWADELEVNARDVPPDEGRPVRAKQCLLRMISMMVFTGGKLDPPDVQQLLTLGVLTHHGYAYGQDTPMQQQMAELRVRCHWQLVRQSNRIVAVAKQNTAMLTRALRSVLQHAPAAMEWEQVSCAGLQQHRSGSFQAVAGGHLYCINCLDGTVLMDGTPPDRLPRDILQHSLYKRCFGDWAFEVSATSHGGYITTSPVRGCFYEFFLAAGNQLVVVEVDEQGHRLELLDAGKNHECEGWGQELPVRLRELHSHWLCRDAAVVVLRAPHFQQRAVQFMLSWDEGEATDGTMRSRVDFKCFRIPPHMQSSSKHWQELKPLLGSDITDQLVLHSSPVTAVMLKMEKQDYIHTYLSWQQRDAVGMKPVLGSPCTVLFELPRFKLEFELRKDGKLWSRDYAGHYLQPCQQLYEDGSLGTGNFLYSNAGIYTLPDFKQYLIMAQQGMKGKQQVLVPEGAVRRTLEHVKVDHSDSSGAVLKVHSYMVHPRFGHLCCASIPARLQLAALYAATSSLLPEPRSHMTGAQIAIRLVRQSWVNKPLQPASSHGFAMQQLDSILSLGGHLASGLRLLVYELKASIAQLQGLHHPGNAQNQIHLPPFSTDWRLAYEVDPIVQQGCNPHLLLTPAEEERVGQLQRAACGPPLWKNLKLYQPIEVPVCPVRGEWVRSAEMQLRKLVLSIGPKQGDAIVPEFPLQAGSAASTPLEKEMHAELDASWQVHHATAAPHVVREDAKQTLIELQAAVKLQQQQAQGYLSTHTSLVPANVGLPAPGFRLLQTAGAAPNPGLLDFMQLALKQETADAFNPFLPTSSAIKLMQGARVWLQLCVLEDRLGRLLNLMDDSSRTAELIQELQVHRAWSVDTHPEWLVFEAEGQLQIQPAQYWVANHLIHHPGDLEKPGSIVQLNMGEGKTRVIMPMLALHWAKGEHLVRLNLLPALLEEAFSHLHTCLCASVLGRQLFVQPFHRDVQVTKPLVAAMHAALTYCKQVGGVLLTTPERRLSLVLKRQELYEQGQVELCTELDRLAALEYIDLLDESDELLSHRYQLIYAWGRPTKLPSEQARARACQALLHIVSQATSGSPLTQSLGAEGVAVWKAPDQPGAYQGVRLLPGEALKGALPQLRRQLAQALVEQPPYALRWMTREGVKDRILDYLVDPSLDATDIIGERSDGEVSESVSEEEGEVRQVVLGEEEGCDLLALRGLLACGVLEHCLQMRHLVEFGVNRSSPVGTTRRKRIAVPFRAAHLPSERSEYAQPDTALVLATLSYYDDGLTQSELLEALHQLLKMGLNAQRAVYQEWWGLLVGSPQVVEGTITPEELRALGDVSKLDTTNSHLMELMHRLFSHNMGAVDYFLNSCVFPVDTRQFPQRLVANAWDLANNPHGRVVGFSGTNDNHRLLPMQVKQELEVESSLKGTNGKMLAVMLDNLQYNTLAPEANGGKAVWEALLRFAVEECLDALIDCGALLAGTSNRSAAEYMLPLLDHGRFKGVCFFVEEHKEWMICDRQGRNLPRHCSPIRESEAFAIFDEARCRGADLQLRLDAVGLLTLGPTTCKDKLMQAAGRLRKLGRGQRLRIAGTADVTAKILRVAGTAHGSPAAVPAQSDGSSGSAGQGITSKEVLQWVMANTVQATLKGVMAWAHQGLQFAAIKDAPQHALQPEVLELHDMYAGSRHPVEVAELVQEQHSRRSRADLAEGMVQLMAGIMERSERYGACHKVVAQGTLGEECERELEQEEEEEEEVEREVPHIQPAKEKDWDYSLALRAVCAESLQRLTGVRLLPLAELAGKVHTHAVGTLPWNQHVFCTPNFAYPVQQDAAAGGLNDYLRPVDSLLLLPRNGDVVLVSGRESNGLLEVLWQGLGSAPSPSPPSITERPVLANLAYTCKVQPGASLLVPPASSTTPELMLGVALHPGDPWTLEGCQVMGLLRSGQLLRQLVHLQLFNGETTYVETGAGQLGWERVREQAPLVELCGVMEGHGAVAEALVGMRGKQVLLSRSQLELACDTK